MTTPIQHKITDLCVVIPNSFDYDDKICYEKQCLWYRAEQEGVQCIHKNNDTDFEIWFFNGNMVKINNLPCLVFYENIIAGENNGINN